MVSSCSQCSSISVRIDTFSPRNGRSFIFNIFSTLCLSGSMCYMSGSIQMENVVPENEAGIWQWLFGKSVASIVLLNIGSSDGFVGIAAPSLARILPIDLVMFGSELSCQPDAFLCSINDVKVTNTVGQRARNVVAGAEEFLRQKISGQGLAFVVAGGSVVQKNLEVGEVLSVDVFCIVALSATVNVQIKYNVPMRRMVFGGDNLVTAVLTGPGIVFIQSLPFHRLSQRIARYMLQCLSNTHNFCYKLQSGSDISKHEGKSKVPFSNILFLLPSLCPYCIITDLD
ncbi:hypothetical protein U1Q18_019362 [Sarracenia purpurea var. burkii]